jgi:pimeloyl-ACP methyl ester carboxylesterase
MAERLGAEVRGARLVEVPEAYHHLVLDRPDAFAKALQEFLDDLDAGEARAGASIRPAAS